MNQTPAIQTDHLTRDFGSVLALLDGALLALALHRFRRARLLGV